MLCGSLGHKTWGEVGEGVLQAGTSWEAGAAGVVRWAESGWKLTLQLEGGFCHKGLVVSVSGEKLSEDRAKQSSQASEEWRWKRLDDFIYWYEE